MPQPPEDEEPLYPRIPVGVAHVNPGSEGRSQARAGWTNQGAVREFADSPRGNGSKPFYGRDWLMTAISRAERSISGREANDQAVAGGRGLVFEGLGKLAQQTDAVATDSEFIE